MKILHVVESLDRGAVENWLLRMFRHATSLGLRPNWSFYCQLPIVGVMEAEATRLGAKVIHSPVPIGHKLAFIRALRAELKTGRYDVLYCHHDLISAIYLVASMGVSLRQRIVHIHNADEALLTPSRIKQSLLREPMRRICLQMADKIVGISHHTLDKFLRGRSRRLGRDLIHYYGIDSQPFNKASVDRAGFRREFGFPEDALVLLFAGRLVPEKNPHFALEVLSELRRREARTVGVFVGSGSEEASLRARATVLDLKTSTRFLGWRTDTPNIMRCCDWFILPRPETPMEGFGIAVVEAQLAGLRLLLSKGIADDPILPGSCVRRLSLSDSASIWAKAACSQLAEPVPSPAQAATTLVNSPMDLDRALAALMDLCKA